MSEKPKTTTGIEDTLWPEPSVRNFRAEGFIGEDLEILRGVAVKSEISGTKGFSLESITGKKSASFVEKMVREGFVKIIFDGKGKQIIITLKSEQLLEQWLTR